MDIKKFEEFSPRDQAELRKMLAELQKLDPPGLSEDKPTAVYFNHYEFYLGREKKFKVMRIK